MVVVRTVVDAAIGWLVQTILGKLFTEKLEAWTRRVGLADDVEKLTSAMNYVQTMVVAAAKGRKIGNEPLAQSLDDLKELLNDAEDVLDELDYYSLQEQVTSGNNMEKNTVAAEYDGRTSSARLPGFFGLHRFFGLGKRKREYDNTVAAEFDTETSSVWLHRFFGLGKRKREDDKIAANTHLGNKSELSARIICIAEKLRNRGRDVAVSLQIDVSSSPGVSNPSQSTPPEVRVTTSYLVESKVYGRDAELQSILKQIPTSQDKQKQDLTAHNKSCARGKRMSHEESNGIIVIPIVGVGGVGKTTLAQLVYNDPLVGNRVDIKKWVCVSDNFDLLRLTRDMLDSVCDQRQAEMCNLDKLQKDLEKQMQSKCFLIVLDDVWSTMTKPFWDKLLAPLKQAKATNGMILVTTRESSVAGLTQTVQPVELGALGDNDFWILFKSCAFGDEKYEEPPNLSHVGKQIALQLGGNPLAAKAVGALLGSDISMANWINILNSTEWKSLQDSNGIMPALKLTYDYLPDHLQQCFRYCCLFPKNYKFHGAELVRIWISQGFVHGSHTGKTLEDTGKVYLADLVNSGFFEKVGWGWRFMQRGDMDGQFVLHDLMHDLACEVSRTEIATINGSGCKDISTTIRHLSIVNNSADDGNCQHGNTFSRENFDKTLEKVTPVVKKLRSLVLIGYYGPSFFEGYHKIFKEAEKLRLLQISATYDDFVSFLKSFEHRTHLRYLKLINNGSGEASPIHLSKCYHLQVLDAGCPTIVHGINDLVSMRYLFVKKRARSSITSVDQNSSCFETTQLQSMMNLVQLGVFQLGNVSRAEAYGAKLRDKKNMEMLHLSWKDTLSQHESDSDTCSEPEDNSDNNSISESIADEESQDERPVVNDDSDPFFEPPSIHMETVAGSPVNDSNCNQVCEHLTDTAGDVLEGFEPHPNLKHLRISEYSGATFPDWLSSKFSVTCMQTLHLDNCGECQVIPSLEMFPFLTKLKLKKMWKVTQVSIPSLEELVLIQMPNLEKCSCNSARNLNSSLRVLTIKRCRVLKAFPLFESCEKFRIEQKSWLSGLNKFVIHDCPQLVVSNPLPPSSRSCELSISRVSTLPTMEGSSDGELIIRDNTEESLHDEDSDGLTELDDKILAFHNLRGLTSLKIVGCDNLMSISLEGLMKLISLKTSKIHYCKNLFPSTALPEDSYEVMAPANYGALPYLKCLSIRRSGAGRWLSLLLRHVQALEELSLSECGQITGLLVEEGESNLSNLSSAPEASSSGNPSDEASSSLDGLLCIPSNLISSLKKMCFEDCDELTFQGNKKGFSEFTSLEELMICDCPKMISSCVYNDKNDDHAANGRRLLLPQSLVQLYISDSPETLQLCFPGHLTSLKKLYLPWSPCLQYLQLHHCTALEELWISGCESLTEVEGPPSLGGIRSLTLSKCTGLIPWLERPLSEGYDVRPRLVHLEIDDWSILTTSSCMHLTSLERLEFKWCRDREKVTSLTDEQERALKLLTSLQELKFCCCCYLEELPAGLHSLPSLKRLEITYCRHISRLPEKGLPPSLEELDIRCCSDELTEECRELATSKLKVKIDGKYVN